MDVVIQHIGAHNKVDEMIKQDAWANREKLEKSNI